MLGAMRSALLFAIGLALLGCGPGKAPQEVDGWALARAALVDGESCYADRPAYCLSDPAFVDAAIQEALDARFDGTMPKLDREVDKVITSARVRYQSASREPEQLAAIAELVAAHYDAPQIDRSDPELVNVDLGALPGELAIRGRTPRIVLADSPLIESFWWSGAEAGRVLARYAAAHPDRDIVRVELLIPKAIGSSKHLAYRYFRKVGRVAFGEVGKSSIYLGPETSLEAMAAGELDLSKDTREFCSKPRTGPSRGWCPWRDDYAQAKAKAAREAKREARKKR